jgi:folate-binding protein YgfZ
MPNLTDIGTQYRIIESGAGWVERTARGRLRLDGADRVSFLQALLTNDLGVLTPARSVYAAYLTPQGRLIADCRVYDRADHVLMDIPAAIASSLAVKLDALIFAEDVRVSDVSAAVVQIGVMGSRAEAMLGDIPFFHAPVDVADVPAFDLFVPEASRASAVAALEAAGIQPVTHAIAEVLRIVAGRPAFGQDMDEHTIPLEAGLLDRAISLTKGCYVGQEVIVRVLHRGGGRVARRLVKLSFDPAITMPPEPGTPLFVGAKEAGRITSSAWSPRSGRVVALGYLSREAAEAGQHLTMRWNSGEVRAEVVGLAG